MTKNLTRTDMLTFAGNLGDSTCALEFLQVTEYISGSINLAEDSSYCLYTFAGTSKNLGNLVLVGYREGRGHVQVMFKDNEKGEAEKHEFENVNLCGIMLSEIFTQQYQHT